MEIFDRKKLKEILKKEGINYIKLAEITKVPLSTIRKIMCGDIENPRIDTIEAIYKALNITTETPESVIDKRIIDKINSLTPEQLKLIENIVDNFNIKK